MPWWHKPSTRGPLPPGVKPPPDAPPQLRRKAPGPATQCGMVGCDEPCSWRVTQCGVSFCICDRHRTLYEQALRARAPRLLEQTTFEATNPPTPA